MEGFLQAFILSFREGLEAFLIVAILLKFLDKTNNKTLKSKVWHGVAWGVGISFIFGFILMYLSSLLNKTGEVAKLWESFASIIAVILITTFIIWMIKHSKDLKGHIEKKAMINLTGKGIFLLALFMVLREGVEVSIFAFAGKYAILPILAGILLSVVVVTLIFYSIINIKLSTIFNITLAYLILQAGFLIGYGIHEGFSASKDLGLIEPNNPIFTKAYDLSKTVLYHKEGILGVPMYVLFGWYSKPEWIQFIVQYFYTLSLFMFWWIDSRKHLA